MSSIKFFLLFMAIIGLIVMFIIKSPFTSDGLTERYSSAAQSIINCSLTDTTGYNWLEELCEIGPRLSGSENSGKAIQWAFEKFKEIKADSVWLQPVLVPRWVRGSKESAVISKSDKYSGRKLSVASLGGSVGTNNKILTGKIIELKKFEDIKKIDPSSTKGKVFFLNEPFDETIPETFEAYGKAVQQRVYGAIEAAKLGGIAVIVRSVTSKYDNTPHVGTLIYADSIKQVPGLAIGLQDADFLSDLLREEPTAEISLDLDCQTLPDVESYNVIAEVRGSEFPEDIILVGGHFDSWDKGDGAHDDGAPCIQTMEVLHHIKKLNLRPKRTIRCVLFINEENGLRGGIKYGELASAEGWKHLAAIESDRGAFEPRGFNVEADDKVIEEMNNWLPLLSKTKIDWIKKGGAGADISRIQGTVAKIGFVPDDQRYFDFHHSDNDVFESVDKREMRLGTAAITLLAYLISEEGI